MLEPAAARLAREGVGEEGEEEWEGKKIATRQNAVPFWNSFNRDALDRVIGV